MKAVILAAGKGTRFNSELPKVLQQIDGKTLIEHVVELAQDLACEEILVVIGYRGELVQEKLAGSAGVSFVWQHEQLGTGHAVAQALPSLEGYSGDVLVLYGDVPGVKLETMKTLVEKHKNSQNDLTLLTADLEDPKAYGRIVKDNEGNVLAIVETKDAGVEELKIHEINSGMLIASCDFLQKTIPKLGKENKQGEYYLTDVVEIGVDLGTKIGAYVITDEDEIKGVNSRDELEEMEVILQSR